MNLDRATYILILLLSALGLYCSFIIGISWDEYISNIEASARIDFLKSFGKNLDYLKYEEFHNPGFYEVILAFLSNLFHAFWVFEVRHLLNSNKNLLNHLVDNKENFGKGYAIKKGLEIATGDYIIQKLVRKGIKYISVYKHFLKGDVYSNVSDNYIYSDPHFNRQGNKILSDIIWEEHLKNFRNH